MKDDYYIKNENYKIIDKINNDDKYINDYKYEKIENFNFYENIDYKSKYDSMSDKELERLLSAALRNNRSNVTPTIVPTPIPTTMTNQTQVQMPTTTPNPVPTIPNVASVPTPAQPAATTKPNTMIQRFLEDTTSATVNRDFRGWVLPNGQLVSQYNDNGSLGRQDHGALVRLFINGLQEYDSAKYDDLMSIYTDYVSKNYNARDVYESFAVDALGWMQVSEFGSKRIIARQERWQDRLLAPFIIDFGFDLVSSNNPNQGLCYDSRFFRLYDNVKDIITLGLEKRYSSSISR